MLEGDQPAAASSNDKANATWEAGWWDFYPLAEHTRRPIAWSRSSVIFTSHEFQPLLLAHEFPSSRPIHLPMPHILAASPELYEPPTVISVSPDDHWLFAYFPAREIDVHGTAVQGFGCLWQCGDHLDDWSVKDWISPVRGGAVVAAAWNDTEREWVATADGIQNRRPPRGVNAPNLETTLFVVTETHQLNIYYVRQYPSVLKVMSCNLLQRNSMAEPLQAEITATVPEVIQGRVGRKVCVAAAIAVGYNESCVMVAMRSQVLPPPSALKYPHLSVSDMDMGMPMGPPQMPIPAPDAIPRNDWEDLGEQTNIELCEVAWALNGSAMRLGSNTIQPSIKHPMPLNTGLTFLCPNDSHESGLQSRIYLAASFADFGDYSAPPQTELALYRFSKPMPSPSSKQRLTWSTHLESTRSFLPRVLTHFFPRRPVTGNEDLALYAMTIDSIGSLPVHRKGKARQAHIGSLSVLKIPDLSGDVGFEPSPISTTNAVVTEDLPFNSAISPNGTHVCTAAVSVTAKKMPVHALPWRKHKTGDDSAPNEVSLVLAVAVASRRSVADIAHALSLPSVGLPAVVNILKQSHVILNKSSDRESGRWTSEVLGVALEVYRMRASHARTETERKDMISRWTFAHELCALSAISVGFDHCEEGTTYDLEAVWQLVGFTCWTVDLLETLMRECVLAEVDKAMSPSSDVSISEPHTKHISTITSYASVDMSKLLFLAHPFALAMLQDVLAHIRHFRAYLGSLSPKAENAQIAKDILIDAVDHSGVDLDVLHGLFIQFIDSTKKLAGEHSWGCLDSLMSCRATGQVQMWMYSNVKSVLDSSAVEKPRLFIKPADFLLDGVSKASHADGRKAETKRDVLTKAILTNRRVTLHCARCGGRSEKLGNDGAGPPALLRWRAWQRLWSGRCICGGHWTSIYE